MVFTSPSQFFPCFGLGRHQAGESGIITWKPNPKGFSIKYAISALHQELSAEPWAPLVWEVVLPRHSFIAWSILNNSICTQNFLKKLKWELASRCILCSKDEEDLEHIFFNCSFAKWHWKVFFLKTGWKPPNEATTKGLLIRLAVNFQSQREILKIISCTSCAIVYRIWEERNARTFKE